MIGSVIYKLHMLETAYLDLAVSQCFSFVLLGCHCIISNQGLLIGQGQDVVLGECFSHDSARSDRVGISERLHCIRRGTYFTEDSMCEVDEQLIL